MPLTYEQRSEYACDVCGNVPDEEGCLEHGRGCYVVDSDGGGCSYVQFEEETPCPSLPDTNSGSPPASNSPG